MHISNDLFLYILFNRRINHLQNKQQYKCISVAFGSWIVYILIFPIQRVHCKTITNNLLKVMLYTNKLCLSWALIICHDSCISFISIGFYGKLRGSYYCNNSRPVNQAVLFLHSRKILCILGLLM